jgi:hypothetical protein
MVQHIPHNRKKELAYDWRREERGAGNYITQCQGAVSEKSLRTIATALQ